MVPNMSLGAEGSDADLDPTARLRALAHPIRLRMLSLLTGAAMTAAEIARELAITHANASYHLRQLLAADLVEIIGKEHIQGGVAKRYRYRLEPAQERPVDAHDATTGDAARDIAATDELQLVFAAATVELQRRAALRKPGPTQFTDAELWVDPAEWDAVREQVGAAAVRLHRAAHPPRTPGMIRVNATIAMFAMESEESG